MQIPTHTVPCAELQVLEEKMNNFESWQKVQNGSLQTIQQDLNKLPTQISDLRRDILSDGAPRILNAEKDLRDVRTDMTAAIKDVRDRIYADLKEIKDGNNQFRLLVFGSLLSSLATLIMFILNHLAATPKP